MTPRTDPAASFLRNAEKNIETIREYSRIKKEIDCTASFIQFAKALDEASKSVVQS